MARAENINPRLLIWARETAGLSVEEAAARLGLTTTQKDSATDKLQFLEAGERKPTRKQLLKIASIYRRPLTTFYKNAPPELGDRGEDFRTQRGAVSRQDSALLDALLRDIRARQDMVRAILEDDEDARHLGFVGSMNIAQPVVEAAARIREAVGIEVAQQRNLNDPSSLFSQLRICVEQMGVFVLLVGNLGSHHTNISEKIFRGFAIADELAPFIVINDQDAQTARTFTLIHELAHIFVGSTGVSGAPSTIAPETPLARVERFCNDVASEFLLPEDQIPERAPYDSIDAATENIQHTAQNWSVSEPMVAYRFWRIARITEEHYRELSAMYAARWQAHRNRNRERYRKQEGGPNYYVVRKHRLGNALLNLVGRSVRENVLTYTKAAKMLGVKPSSVTPLLTNLKAVSGTFIAQQGG